MEGTIYQSDAPELIKVNADAARKIDLLHSSIKSISNPEFDLLSSSPDSSISSCVDLGEMGMETINRLVSEFTDRINAAGLTEHSNLMYAQYDEALTENSKISMLPSYDIQPTGKEEGSYLVVDLGGSTLRVSVVQIDPYVSDAQDRASRIHIVNGKSWHVNDDHKLIDGEFFKWIGSKIVEVLLEQSLINYQSEVVNTGITWSFPLDKATHNSGNIVNVGKGYIISPDVYHKDLRLCLQHALKEHFNLTLDVKAVINDSVAVYCAGSFLDDRIKLAMVLGTGINMCFSLQSAKLHREKCLQVNSVLLNSELSLFGSGCCAELSTKHDGSVDKRFSIVEEELHFKPHMSRDPQNSMIFQPIELMTSGRYIGELVRLAILDCFEAGEIFTNIPKQELKFLLKPYEGISGELICCFSENEDYLQIRDTISSINGHISSFITDRDILILKMITSAVIKRAAYIIAAAIIACINLLKSHNKEEFSQNRLTIGFVGSVLEYLHSYREQALTYINENQEIRDANLTVDFKSIEDSSIVGAAIGAAYYVT